MLFPSSVLLIAAVTADSPSSPNPQTLTHSDPITKPVLNSILPPSSTPGPCPLLSQRCGSIGCYDQATHKCCPSEKNVCETTQNCVEIQLANENIAHGCCPSGTLACGDTCFDTSDSKCCVRPGGGFGLCPVGADCCADMCCGDGEVCANAMGGPKCWPKTPLDEWSTTENHTGIATSVDTTTIHVSVNSSSKMLQSSISAPATKSSGAAKSVAPWLLCILLLLPSALAFAGPTLSPVNFERDISKVKDFSGSQASPATGPTSSTRATSTGPTTTTIVDRIVMGNIDGDPFDKKGGGHGGRGGMGGGRGGSKGNSSASRMAIGGMETFAGVKIGAVHIAALAVFLAAMYSLV